MKRLLTAVLSTLLLASPGYPGHPGLPGYAENASLADGDVVRFDGHKVVRTMLTNRRQIERMFEISPDLWSEAVGLGGPTDWRIPPDQMDELDASGIPYQVIIEDVQALIDNSRNPGNPGNPGSPLGGGWYNNYKTFGEYTTQLEVLRDLQPTLATTFDVGTSIEGRTIRGIRFGGDGPSSPVFVIQGCQHAREWISPMVTMFIIDHLLSNYGVDPEVTRLVDAVEFIIVPMVNPDGYEYTWTNNRMWRKNRRNNGGGSWGVDLNRNWSVGWGGNDGSSGNPDSDIYRGTGPFSEPETTAVKNLIDSEPDRIGFHLDIHSYSQLILTPWGYTRNLPPDHDIYQQIASDMQEAIRSVHGMTYIFGSAANVLYIASGISPDYTTGTYGVPGFTFELRDTGQFGFLLPPEQIIPNGEEIVPSIKVIANWLSRIMEFEFPNGVPNSIDPNTPTPVSVQIAGVNGAEIEPTSAKLFARVGETGQFNESALDHLGGDQYEAMLPATPCGSTLQFYFEAQTTTGGVSRSPLDAPATIYEAMSINESIVFEDDFENDLGWSVENIDLSDGAWARGAPVGGGDRGDPVSDFDGSGQCFLTNPADGNTDVDGGPTRLISPILDLAGMNEATLSYARYFFNDDGDDDALDIEISNDGGGSWTLIERVTAFGGTGWVYITVRVADYVSPTNQVVVRFSATDNPNDSVTEAAIDAFKVGEVDCADGTSLTGFAVTTGTILEGDLEALRIADDLYLRARSGFGLTFVDLHNMTMEVTAVTNVNAPTNMDLRFEWRINEPSGTAQVRARNTGTGEYDLVGSFAVGDGADQIETLTNLSAADYVDGGGTVQLELKHIVFVPFVAFTFESFVDEVNVDVR